MYRALARTLPLFAALATLGLAAPHMALAQDPQHNESDIDFMKRMIASLKQTERLAESLEKNFQQVARQRQSQGMSAEMDARTARDDRYGSRMQDSSGNRSSDLRRAEMRMRSTRKDAIREREQLTELQRSGDSLEPKEREKIQATVSRLARKVADMQRDIELGRF